MLRDGMSLGFVTLTLRHVVPTLRLPARRRMRRQAAADGKDVRRFRDIAGGNRRRPGSRHDEAVLAQAPQGGDRQLALRVRNTIGGAIRQATLSRKLVEVGGGDDTLRRTMLTDEHDLL